MSVYDTWRAAQDIINLAAQLYEAELWEERNTNAIKNLKLNQVNDWIDNQVNAISNLADAKVYLKIFSKRVVRYLKAHER